MATVRKDALPRNEPDMEAFRLRSFVQRLIALGECEVIEQNADLADLAAKLDGFVSGREQELELALKLARGGGR